MDDDDSLQDGHVAGVMGTLAKNTPKRKMAKRTPRTDPAPQGGHVVQTARTGVEPENTEWEGRDTLAPAIKDELADRTVRAPDGTFAEGHCGGPGRPRGAWGRGAALKVLDDLMGDAGNQGLLRAAMQAEFEKRPVLFFRRIVMPLIPRDAIRVDVGEGGLSIKFVGNVSEARL